MRLLWGTHLLATELTQEILNQKIQEASAQAGEKITVDFGNAGQDQDVKGKADGRTALTISNQAKPIEFTKLKQLVVTGDDNQIKMPGSDYRNLDVSINNSVIF